jgi:hypothetical protein
MDGKHMDNNSAFIVDLFVSSYSHFKYNAKLVGTRKNHSLGLL